MTITKVMIASSRNTQIGNRCQAYARQVLPDGYELVYNHNACDVFISVLYDTLLTKEFIDGRRCYNFHPGILPAYRGAGAYSWALINKEELTGVTLHEIDRNIDSGPTIAKLTTKITAQDTAQTLFDRSMDLLYNLFTTYFQSLIEGSCISYPENWGGTLYLRSHLEPQKNLSHYIKAFTFDDKECAYWYDSTGEKHYIEWN
jgi:methionyl-tRNA formyltransferase